MKAKHEQGTRYGVLGALYGHHHQQGGGADQVEKKKVRSRSLLSFTAWHGCAAKISLGFIAVTSDTEKAPACYEDQIRKILCVSILLTSERSISLLIKDPDTKS